MHDLVILTIPTGLAVTAAGLIGAAIGSFVGAALMRMPEGRSLIVGRSACDACGAAIRPLDLIPLVSWLALRGHCRDCGARIGLWQPACELGGAMIGVLPVLTAPPDLMLPAMLFGWQLLLLAVLDARHLWLPRSLSALLAVSGAGWALLDSWQAQSPAPAIMAVVGGLLGFGLLWGVARAYRLLRGRHGIGGGDPLLLGAIGLWIGPVGVIWTLLGGSLIGLAAALAMLATRRAVAGDTMLPLGTLLALAAWPVFVWGGLV